MINKPLARRIQRRRKKGWIKPAGAIYIGRPSPYANPYKIGSAHPLFDHPISAEEAVHLFEIELLRKIQARELETILNLERLRGHDLMCWCRLDSPCHGDIWIREANR